MSSATISTLQRNNFNKNSNINSKNKYSQQSSLNSNNYNKNFGSNNDSNNRNVSSMNSATFNNKNKKDNSENNTTHNMNSLLEKLDDKYLNGLYKHSVEYNQENKFTQNDKKVIMSTFDGYLDSLNLYLDDDIYYSKYSKLPAISSNLISKVEKLMTQNDGIFDKGKNLKF